MVVAHNSISKIGVNEVVYEYDAWGNILSTDGFMADTLGQINPLRYRGYVYDTETGLYYLQSRYYDPEVGRFLNADKFISTNQGLISNNMYTYCLNDPIIHKDSSGMWTLTIGFGGNVTAFLGISIGIGLSFDDEGGIALQVNYSQPNRRDTTSVGLLDAGAALQAQVTKQDTVDDLEGVSTYLGGSGGFLGYAGADVVLDAPIADPFGEIQGIQGSFGAGAGVDIHVSQTNTKTLWKSTWRDIWRRIWE